MPVYNTSNKHVLKPLHLQAATIHKTIQLSSLHSYLISIQQMDANLHQEVP